VALGVLEAVRELQREQTVAIAGQDCIAEAIEEIRKPGSPLIASVDHFAESYGERLIALGLNILRGRLCLLTTLLNTRWSHTRLSKRATRRKIAQRMETGRRRRPDPS